MRISLLTRWMIAVVLAALIPAAAQTPQSVNPESMLRTAIEREEVDGNLPAAIDLYKQVVARSNDNRALAAKALLRLGGCYEKQGNAEARKTFEQLLKDYADQVEIASQARTRLAALAKSEPTSPPPATPTVRQLWAGEQRVPTGPISPDGRYMAYDGDEGKNLYIRDLSTGAVRKVTLYGLDSDHNLYSMDPGWSADSRWLAYGLYRKNSLDLCVVALDDPEPRVIYSTKEEDAYIWNIAWMPDGKSLLANMTAKDNALGLQLVSIEGGLLRSITRNSTCLSPSISPDGRYITCNSNSGRKPGFKELNVLRIADGEIQSALPIENLDRLWGWSPDGHYLLFTSDKNGSVGLWRQTMLDGKADGVADLLKPNIGSALYLSVDRNGWVYYRTMSRRSDIYVSTFDFAAGKLDRPPLRLGNSPLGMDRTPRWSPDGKWLAYFCPQSADERMSSRTLCLWPSDGGQLRQITLDRETEWLYLSWTSDAQYLIATSRDREMPLRRFNSQTGQSNGIDIGKGRAFAWTPDGQVVFKWDRTAMSHPDARLISRETASGQERELFRSPERCVPSTLYTPVSPDGKWLAFVRDVIGENDHISYSTLHLVPVSGGVVREIARTREGEDPRKALRVQSWSADSKFVYYSLGPGGRLSEMWRLAVNGGEPTRLALALGEFSNSLTDFRLHPDGKRLAFTTSTSPGPPEVWVMENFLPPAKSAKEAKLEVRR